MSPAPVSFRDLVKDSLRLIERQAQDKKITLNTRYVTQIDRVTMDADRINQVLLNLYLNAIEAMEPGGQLQVEISENSTKDGLRIQVSDTGRGIAGEDLSKIFDPYFTTKSTGTGLGLAIAHNIIEAMGGTIKAHSQAGKGTTFTLNLPIELEV